MIRHARLLPALAAAALVACAGGQPPAFKGTPAERVSMLERRAEGSGAASDLARAGLTTWVVTGDGAQAERLFDRALKADAGEPWALWGRMLLAREALDDDALVRFGTELLTRTPQSPAAELAASLLFDAAQRAPSTDDRIESALAPLVSGSGGLTGAAALRAREALLAVRDGRNDEAATDAVRRALGMPEAWTVIGPQGALRLRDFDRTSPVAAADHALQRSYESPLGQVAPRVMPSPSGVLDLQAESWRGDVFDALVDLDVKEPGTHLLSLRGASPVSVRVDGVEVLERAAVPRRAPERSWAAVDLPAGPHRLHVRFSRSEGSWLSLLLARADGAPTRIAMRAPQQGDAAPKPSVRARRADLPTDAGQWADALLKRDAVDPFAWYVRVWSLSTDDSERARALLPRLAGAAGDSPATRLLSADLATSDPELPRAEKTSLIARELDAALARQPGLARALLQRFEHERGDKRFDEARARLDALEELVGADHVQHLIARARLAADQADLASTRRLLDQVLVKEPGHCGALDQRSDLARRDDEVEVANRLAPQLERCPGGIAANASFWRGRGRLDLARPYLERLVARSPTSLRTRRPLADALVALGDVAGARKVMQPLVEWWPRDGGPLHYLAYLAELDGDDARTTELTRQALRAEGFDLGSARRIALGRGTEVLDWAARDGLKAISDYGVSDWRPNASAVQVLDLAGIELFPDGSGVERVHSIVQVLDKSGIDRYGEVELPPGAQALVVRTVKPDGRLLDAEIISGKESISMPNLEPGDFVEYEFLRALSARPASVPGYAGGLFFFQTADVPFFESSYRVKVPKSLGLDVESNLIDELPQVAEEGGYLFYGYTNRRVPAFVREPLSVGDDELLPWIEVGSGAGTEDEVRMVADWAPLRWRVSNEVAELVRPMRSMKPADRVRAIVEAVREQVKGDSASLDMSRDAGTILNAGRGNRMVLLKAALDAAGVPSRVVLVRPFHANPRDHRFPRLANYRNALLRIEPDGSSPMWIDFSLRDAPLGPMPAAYSESDAWVLPNPGEDVKRVTLPKVDPSQDRTDALMDLTLEADGTLVGTVTQVSYGYDAAFLRRRLERTSKAELHQHQERALSGSFRGVVLESLDVQDTGKPDEPVRAVSTIRVPRFGQRADGSVGMPANFGPQLLGRRFLGRGERRTPLLIASDEEVRLQVRLKLPEGTKAEAPRNAKVSTAFGDFEARWKLADGVLSLEERTRLNRGRIPPERYASFRAFAVEVDAAQAREIPLQLPR